MGRSKKLIYDRAQRKKNKENKALGRHGHEAAVEGMPAGNQPFNTLPFGAAAIEGVYQRRPNSRRTGLVDTRRRSQTSNNSRLHAALFVVLAAIVISWALGY